MKLSDSVHRLLRTAGCRTPMLDSEKLPGGGGQAGAAAAAAGSDVEGRLTTARRGLQARFRAGEASCFQRFSGGYYYCANLS